MVPETADSSVRDRGATRTRRSRAKARPAPGGGAEQPVARVMQLVAALKAEQEAGSPLAPAGKTDDRIRLMTWLRRILGAREEERRGWEEQIRRLGAELGAAKELAEQARAAAADTTVQHHRLVADLKLMHEHQRSIWELERRRLEITVEGFERAQRRGILRRAARLARPAVAAGLILAAFAAVALSADSSAAGARYLDDGVHAAFVALGPH
jgi:hypothetical protein